jgi:hypothetical protein
MVLSSYLSSTYTRSQKRTYQNETAKKTTTSAMKIRSIISALLLAAFVSRNQH